MRPYPEEAQAGPGSPFSNRSYQQMAPQNGMSPPNGTGAGANSVVGTGGERIDVRVRPDKTNRGDLTVRVTGVTDDIGDDDGGPWGAKGPLWFLSRLLVLIMSIIIAATRGWALGGPRFVNIIMKVDQVGDVSDRAYIEWSEIGLVTACYKAMAASAVLGPLDGMECDSVWDKWDEDLWMIAFIFAVCFIILLGFRLTLEAAELFNPGCLPVQFQNPIFLRLVRHLTWILMLLPWALFLGHWQRDRFDPLDIEYTEITDLHWGFWTWLGLWILWMFKVIFIECGLI